MKANSCPFCRQISPKTQEEADQNDKNRAEKNDPAALFRMGTLCVNRGDYDGAFRHWTKAAGLGDVEAHYQLSVMYMEGHGGVEKDEKKETYHLEEAAAGGDVGARYSLGLLEWNNGNYQRAVKHLIIAAKLGCNHSLDCLKTSYAKGFVRKEDLEAALRTHQAAVDATKSAQREAAEKSSFMRAYSLDERN